MSKPLTPTSEAIDQSWKNLITTLPPEPLFKKGALLPEIQAALKKSVELNRVEDFKAALDAGGKIYLEELLMLQLNYAESTPITPVFLQAALEKGVSARKPADVWRLLFRTHKSQLFTLDVFKTVGTLNIPLTSKIYRDLWHDTDAKMLAIGIKAGLPLIPEHWTPSFQKDFDELLSPQMMFEVGNMEEFIEVIQEKTNETFNPLKDYHQGKKSEKLWQEILWNSYDNIDPDDIAMVIRFGLIPPIRGHLPKCPHHPPMSWPLMALLRGHENVYQFLMRDPLQKLLFKEDIQTRITLLEEIQTLFPNRVSNIYTPLIQANFDFTQTTQYGSFFHALFFANHLIGISPLREQEKACLFSHASTILSNQDEKGRYAVDLLGDKTLVFENEKKGDPEKVSPTEFLSQLQKKCLEELNPSQKSKSVLRL